MKATNKYISDYFKGFQDLSTFNTNDTVTNALGLLKVISYFTVVIPVMFGGAYVAPILVDRIKQYLSSLDPVFEEEIDQTFRRVYPLELSEGDKLFELAIKFLVGDGVNQDLDAFELLFKNAEEKKSNHIEPNHLYHLALKYFPNNNLAYTVLLKKAAERGSAEAKQKQQQNH